MYAHFVPTQDLSASSYEGGMDLLMIMYDQAEPNDSEWVAFYSVAGAVDDRRFLSLEAIIGEPAPDEEDNTPDFHLFTYDMPDPNTLTITRLSDAALEEAIETGALRGEIHDGPYGGATISATPDELITFLRETGFPGSLFEEDSTHLVRLPQVPLLP